MRAYGHLSDRHFNALVLVLIGLSGASLLWGELA
jgi:hypothetical protein